MIRPLDLVSKQLKSYTQRVILHLVIYHSRIDVLQIAPFLAKTDALIILVSAFIHEKNNFCLGHGQNINPQNQH